MSEVWRETLSLTLSAIIVALCAWVAKAAWDRNTDKLKEALAENDVLKTRKTEEDQKRMETLMREMSDTRYAVTKLEAKIEELVKLIPDVSKMSKDLHALWAWRRANFPNGPTQ